MSGIKKFEIPYDEGENPWESINAASKRYAQLLGSHLFESDKYKELREMMKAKNIDIHSIEGAEILIENGLAFYVVASIKEYNPNIHDKIIDLLIQKKECSCLKGDNNMMIKDFKINEVKTAYKLFCTGNFKTTDHFLGFDYNSIADRQKSHNSSNLNKIEYSLNYFEDNSIIRRGIIDSLKNKDNELLKYLFENVSFKKIKGWLTPEELDEHKDFLDYLEKILSE